MYILKILRKRFTQTTPQLNRGQLKEYLQRLEKKQEKQKSIGFYQLKREFKNNSDLKCQE